MENKINDLLESKKLSELKMYLLESKRYEKSSDLSQILGLVEITLGNFSESLKYFRDKQSSQYFEFVSTELKEKYIPKYNLLLENIKNKDIIDEEEIRYLESVIPNVELYYLVSLYYFKNKKIKLAKKYIEKGLSLCSDSLNLRNLKKETEKKGSKFFSTVTISSSILVLILLMSNVSNKLRFEREENLKILNQLSLKDIEMKSLKAEILGITELRSNENINNSIISDFNSRELFIKAKKLRKNKEFAKASEYFVYILEREDKTIYTREALFWYARTLEDLGEFDKAVESYKKYLTEFRESNIYINEISTRLKIISMM